MIICRGISISFLIFNGASLDRTVDSGSNASLFDNSRNHGKNRVNAGQITLRTILTVAGFSVYYRMFW
jgi:hypothetical protein